MRPRAKGEEDLGVSLLCCGVLQCVAACCSVLQCVAVCCSVLSLDKEKRISEFRSCVAVRCGVLQCVVACCSVLHCVAVCCSVLPRVAACVIV